MVRMEVVFAGANVAGRRLANKNASILLASAPTAVETKVSPI